MFLVNTKIKDKEADQNPCSLMIITKKLVAYSIKSLVADLDLTTRASNSLKNNLDLVMRSQASYKIRYLE